MGLMKKLPRLESSCSCHPWKAFQLHRTVNWHLKLEMRWLRIRFFCSKQCRKLRFKHQMSREINRNIYVIQNGKKGCCSTKFAKECHCSKLGVSGPIFSKSTRSCGTGSPSEASTSIATRAPACSAPLMYPGHQVAVSVPAKLMRACESLMVSPPIVIAAALAVPTGQPPVNGSLAQSSSKYLHDVHNLLCGGSGVLDALSEVLRIRAKVIG